jgi:hypothetical protein
MLFAASIVPVTVLGGKLVTDDKLFGVMNMLPVTVLPPPVDPVIAE